MQKFPGVDSRFVDKTKFLESVERDRLVCVFTSRDGTERQIRAEAIFLADNCGGRGRIGQDSHFIVYEPGDAGCSKWWRRYEVRSWRKLYETLVREERERVRQYTKELDEDEYLRNADDKDPIWDPNIVWR